MDRRIDDLTGKKFGRLTVIKENGRTNGKRKLVKWICRCECGNIVERTGKALKTSKNSGCDNCKFIREDLTGKRYGKIKVLSMKGHENGTIIWNCVCDCGKELEVSTGRLNSGHVQSCGCVKKERLIKQNTTHGKSNTRLYEIWIGMKKRCYNSNCSAYESYGGRGICICNEWLSDFMNFYIWAMGSGYNDNLSIDRIDVNGNYEPSNCRWATTDEQSSNKRDTVYYEMFGLKKPLTEWCKYAEIKYYRAYQRLYNGNQPFDKEELMKIEKNFKNGGN